MVCVNTEIKVTEFTAVCNVSIAEIVQKSSKRELSKHLKQILAKKPKFFVMDELGLNLNCL